MVMGAAGKIPLTRYELAALGPGLHRFPATEDDYWRLIASSEYYAEFQGNEIISMIYDTNLHSRLTTSFIRILANIFWNSDQYTPHNSNRPVYVQATGAIYNPDALVVAEPAEYYEYRPGMNVEKTPAIIVEILSKSTRKHDLEDKLPAYKSIASLELILYVELTAPVVTMHQRATDSGLWHSSTLNGLDSIVEIGGQRVSLKEIYHKIDFDQAGN